MAAAISIGAAMRATHTQGMTLPFQVRPTP